MCAWSRLYRGGADEHRRCVCAQVDWSELFSDLVMVAVALRISVSIKADLSWATLGLLVAEFYCLFFSWSDLAGVYTVTV